MMKDRNVMSLCVFVFKNLADRPLQDLIILMVLGIF